MSQTSEKGNGWEVTREFIAPEQAELIGQQALLLIEEDRECIVEWPPEDLVLATDVSVWEIEDWYDPGSPNNPAGEYLQATAPNLIAVATEIMLGRTRSTDDMIVLNHFDTSGFIKVHVDHVQRDIDRSVISLLGPRVFYIRDLVTRAWKGFELNPGDRVDIDNSGVHPPHTAFNPSDQERSLSLVK